MKRKIGFALAALILGAGVFAQTPDPYGKYDSPVTVSVGMRVSADGKFPDGDGPANNIFTRYLKEKYNIVVTNTFQASTADYPQKVNLAIAANDLPDAMVVNDVQLRQMLKAGQLQDLTEAWNKYASPILKDAWNKTNGTAAKAVVFGGKMMALPAITVPDDGYTLCWIRQDWLDKLGLKVPKTMAELEAVAKAFVEKNPGNLPKGKTIGIGGPQSGGQLYGDFLVNSTNNNFAFDPIFSAYGANPGYWVNKDGKAVYGSIQPEAKAALANLADLYKKKLIDPQMALRKDATEGIVAGQVGIFFGPWWHGYWPFPDAMKQTPDANWQAYAVPLTADGKWAPHTGSNHREFIVVRKGYAKPDAVVKILNGYVRDQGTFDRSTTRGENYPLYLPVAMSDELGMSRKASLEVALGKKKIEDYQTDAYRSYPNLITDIKAFLAIKRAPFDNMDIKTWDTTSKDWPRTYSIMVGARPIYDNGAPLGAQIPFFSTTKTIETKWSSLKKLEDETYLTIILGDKPISAFDDFVAKWKSQGGDTITTEVQKELAQ